MAASRYGEGSVYYDSARELWVGQVYLGPGRRPKVTSRSKAEMLKKMRALQVRKDQGSVVSPLSVDAWLDTWLTTILPRRVEEGTLETYTRWAADYLRPHLGPIFLADLSLEDVERMMLALEDAGLAPRTVKAARGLLRQALGAAKKRGQVSTNVAADAEGPRIRGAKTDDSLTVEEATAVLKTLKGDRLFALAVLALHLGLRPGEAFGLQWHQVDLKGGTIHITTTLKRRRDGSWYLKQPKTDAGQRPGLPLPGVAVTALRAHHRRQLADGSASPDGFVFTTPEGEPLKARDVLTWWHQALARAGVKRRRFYATRHTAATLMLNHGVALEVVSKILGHAGYAITADIYAKVGGKMERDAVATMEGVLGL
jgi:integrase